jgi:cytochrome c oxidase subunit IV
MATAAHGARRPTAKTYWLIAVFLAVITAIEIAIPYIDGFGYLRAPMLIFFSAVKFFTVVGIFMHLRYDFSAFRAYFLVGLLGAISVFLVVLATFRAL